MLVSQQINYSFKLNLFINMDYIFQYKDLRLL
jgi:hypothetical protein